MGKKSKAKRPTRHKLPPITTPPPEIAAAIDRVSADDRDWFALHPGEDQRTRPAAPNEFWPTFDSACVKYVIVKQVQPGFRLRFPILRINLPERERVQ